MKNSNRSFKNLVIIGLLIFMANLTFAKIANSCKTHDMVNTPSLSELYDMVENLAYNNIPNDILRTHVWLTLKAIELYEKATGDKLTPAEKALILIGCIEEDFDTKDSSCIGKYCDVNWSDRIFEKLNKDILIDKEKGIIQYNRTENHFDPKLNYGTGVDTALNTSASQWAYSSPNNNYDWIDALDLNNDQIMRLKAIGHVIHVIEDMIIPSHVRHDCHILKGDYYEDALGDIPFTQYDKLRLEMPTEIFFPGIDLEIAFKTLSEYFSSHFFSNDTMFLDEYERSPLPHVEIGKFIHKIGDEWFILNSDGQIIAQYTYYTDNSVSFASNYAQARQLVEKKFIIPAGHLDLLQAAVKLCVPFCAGVIKMHKDIMQNDIGYFANGWDRNISMAFVKCFYENGCVEKGWKTFDNGKGSIVHRWPDEGNYFLWVQDYLTGDGDWAWIVYNSSLNKAFSIEGEILIAYFKNWGYSKFGAPKTLAYPVNAGSTAEGYIKIGKCQEFEKGMIIWGTDFVELHYYSNQELGYRMALGEKKEIPMSETSTVNTQTRLQTLNPGQVLIYGKIFDLMPVRYFRRDIGNYSFAVLFVGPTPNTPYAYVEITLEETRELIRQYPYLRERLDDKSLYYLDTGAKYSDKIADVPELGFSFTTVATVKNAYSMRNNPNMVNVGTERAPLYVPRNSPAHLNIVNQYCPAGWELGYDGKLRKIENGKSVLNPSYGDTILLPSGMIINSSDSSYRDYFFTFYSSFATPEQLTAWEKEHPPKLSAAAQQTSAAYSMALMPHGSSAISNFTPADQAVQNFLTAEFKNPPLNTEAAPVPVEYVLQPGPGKGKDIWITNGYRMGRGFGFAGSDNYKLSVGGQTKTYIALIQFDLTNMPASAKSAKLFLYNATDRGASTAMYLDRITNAWSWVRGQWWKDKPEATKIADIQAPEVNAWCEIDITELYNGWQNGKYPNYGLQLRPQWTNNNWNEFYSADYLQDPSLRPKLVITN